MAKAKRSKKTVLVRRKPADAPKPAARTKAPAQSAKTVAKSAALAKRVEHRREAAAKTAEEIRRDRRKEYEQAVGAAPSGVRARRVGMRSRDAKLPLRILAEGDSWFDFPFGGRPFRSGDVIARLGELIRYPILNEAVRGDEARQLLGVKQRARIESLLADKQLDINVLLFSGGGNDIVGDPLCLWINDRDSVEGQVQRAINDVAFGHAVGIVRCAYEQLVAIRDAAVEQTSGRQITLFLHAYDFAWPTGVGVCGFGPWLKPSLEYRGWNNEEAAAIVRALLTSFRDVIEEVAQASQDVFVVATQATLVRHEWNDELHPNRAGFGKIAQKFHEAMRQRFPQEVP